MTVDLAQADQQAGLRKRNYFVRHWNGELSLPVSYWANLVLIGNALWLGGPALIERALANATLQYIAGGLIFHMLTSVALWIWAIVGVWRSSNKHVSRGGSSAWAGIAKIAVAISIAGMTAGLSQIYGPLIREVAPLAVGNDRLGPFTVTVVNGGRTILVQGALRQGAADEIGKVLDATPSATSLVLSSHGGRLFEAGRLAGMVRQRSLSTGVADFCESACTYVFLAGKERMATRDAKFGFHNPAFPVSDLFDSGREYQSRIYREAGLPNWFIEHVKRLSAEEMWYPDYYELFHARVVTKFVP
jgi:hypothetical protein